MRDPFDGRREIGLWGQFSISVQPFKSFSTCVGRALLYKHGHVFSIGTRHLDRMTALVEDETSDLPALIREECQDLLAQIAEKAARIP